MRKMHLYIIPTLILIVGLLSSCAVDPEDDITPDNEPTTKHERKAWLWAYDADTDSVRVFHTVDLLQWASFSAKMHSMMRVMEGGLINANLNYSQWMAKGNQIYAFTDGILDHSDHGHIVIPIVHQTIIVDQNANLVHHGRSYDGQKVAFADDAQQQVVIVNVQDGNVTTINHGSAHSAAILTDDYVITTAATPTTEKWANLIDITSGEIDTTLEIGTGAHGDTYYNAKNTAFIACSDGIYVIDVDMKQVKKTIAYREEGRTNFIYHTPGESFAVGLHKTDSGTSDKLMLLDLANETLEYVTISGAELDWNVSSGLFALSREGNVAVFSDKSEAKIYHVTLETRDIITLDSPVAATPVAVDFNGNNIWALSGQNVSRIYVPDNNIEDTITVPAGTDWIWVTSYKTGAELYDNDIHEF